MSEDRDDGRLVGEHYGRDDLAVKIFEALRAAGRNPDTLTDTLAIEDLTPIDH
jgi:hypothetical protein